MSSMFVSSSTTTRGPFYRRQLIEVIARAFAADIYRDSEFPSGLEYTVCVRVCQDAHGANTPLGYK